MSEHKFIVDLGLALLAALVGGMVARALRMPLLIGYLAAGVAVGPHTPGFIADEKAVHSVASLGVALLMFVVGTHLSLKELHAVRRVALIGGTSQIVGTILLGVLLGPALGWGIYGGLFLGCALSLSSTAVMMRILEERGELGSSHGTAMMAMLVVQDLSVVVMVAILPALATLATTGPAGVMDVALSVLKAAVFVGVAVGLSMKGVPALLGRVVRQGSSELFLLTVVCVCIAAGYLAQTAGLSLELGAFLAGLVISESDYAHEVSNQVRPLRDVFAAIFFVSIGMLLDPAFVVKSLLAVVVVVTAIVFGKSVISAAAALTAGVHGRTAVLVGLGLAQIGEFSFVLTGIGEQRGLIPNGLSGVLLAAALITMLLTPCVFGAAQPLYERLNRWNRISRVLNRQPGAGVPSAEAPMEHARVIILGCGRVGRRVSGALRELGVSHLVVDYDARALDRVGADGVPGIYGDATSELVLQRTRPSFAELAVVALPEAAMTQIAVQTLKRLAPELSVLARVHRSADIPAVRKAGADAVVHGEFEAGIEMIRLGAERLGIVGGRLEPYLSELRATQYRVPD